MSQLGIHYRRSPLSVDGPGAPRKGPRAGDRLPDATIVHKGQSSTVHRMLADPGWHLLLCGPADDWTDKTLTQLVECRAGLVHVHRLTAQRPPGGRRDPNGAALHRLGLTATGAAQYLVRPDGHIGYRAGGTHLTELARYLDRWLRD